MFQQHRFVNLESNRPNYEPELLDPAGNQIAVEACEDRCRHVGPRWRDLSLPLAWSFPYEKAMLRSSPASEDIVLFVK